MLDKYILDKDGKHCVTKTFQNVLIQYYLIAMFKVKIVLALHTCCCLRCLCMGFAFVAKHFRGSWSECYYKFLPWSTDRHPSLGDRLVLCVCCSGA